MLARAKLALARFCLLLLAERVPDSLELLVAATDAGPASLGGQLLERVNGTPHPQPPPALVREIGQLQHLDSQLYDFGAALFEARLQRLRREDAPEQQRL